MGGALSRRLPGLCPSFPLKAGRVVELPHGAGQAGRGRRPPKPHCPRAPQTEYARYENGHYSYRIHRSPLCEYMINFIHKLKHLPEKYMMNSVLENFTILQVCAQGWAQGWVQGCAQGWAQVCAQGCAQGWG